MKFRNDDQRKAVFANLFKRSKSKLSRVNSSSVRNMEIKSQNKVRKVKLQQNSRFRNQKITLKDVEKIKEQSVSCRMCKVKGGKLKEGTCKNCAQENKKFQKDQKKQKEKGVRMLLKENGVLDVFEEFVTATEEDAEEDIMYYLDEIKNTAESSDIRKFLHMIDNLAMVIDRDYAGDLEDSILSYQGGEKFLKVLKELSNEVGYEPAWW